MKWRDMKHGSSDLFSRYSIAAIWVRRGIMQGGDSVKLWFALILQETQIRRIIGWKARIEHEGFAYVFLNYAELQVSNEFTFAVRLQL
jgi:hypothetical protein